MSNKPGSIYRTPAWKQVRLAILDRDHWQCQIRGPLCLRRATDVDHILALAEGGAPLDPSNLRAACKPCNGSRGGLVARQRDASARAWPTWL